VHDSACFDTAIGYLRPQFCSYEGHGARLVLPALDEFADAGQVVALVRIELQLELAPVLDHDARALQVERQCLPVRADAEQRSISGEVGRDDCGEVGLTSRVIERICSTHEDCQCEADARGERGDGRTQVAPSRNQHVQSHACEAGKSSVLRPLGDLQVGSELEARHDQVRKQPR